MISDIKLLNEKALFNFRKLIEDKIFELVKVILNINDPLIELIFKCSIDDEYSLFIGISFINMNNLHLKNWSYSNIVESFEISKESILINFNSGSIFFNYEWGRVESVKKIKCGSF